MEPVTVSKASELSGLSPGQVSNLIFSRMIEPEIRTGNGSGDYSLLGERNVKELKLVHKLKLAGLKPDTVRGILKLINDSSLDWWKEGNSYVVVAGDTFYVTTNPFSELNKSIFEKQGLVLLAKL